MSETNNPLMSVVIATPDHFDTIRMTLQHLMRQTVRRSLELIIVAPSRAHLNVHEAELSEFAAAFVRMQIVEVGTIHSIGRANAAGIRRAAAPIVVLAEDHCFPDPQWAESLIAAHRGPWAAVGPAVRNANPGTAVSWADLFIGYGPWLCPATGREMEFLPGHNTSYKRDRLLDYGQDLESMMEAETLLHWDMRRKGHRLWLEPTALVAHTNFSLWRSWVPVQYYNGRLFAGARARGMAAWRRLIFVAGSPLIPPLRLWRIWKGIEAGEQKRRFMLNLPALVIGLVLDGVGQLVGYAAGIGDAADDVARYEFHRFQHIRAEDRLALAPVSAKVPIA
ncbi:MAG: glycosyltransferase family 2 protein [Nitrospiraceae bacterium]